jgi:ribonucleoside-diphosphate reductase alpha chain
MNLARERGAFAIYDATREENNPFINRIKESDPELIEQMKVHGRRNIALLTIAPTGTTSLMSQTTSGIEPVFMVSYMRRRKVNPNDVNVNVNFVDEVGDSWEEYAVFHHHFNTWLTANGYDPEVVGRLNKADLDAIIEKSPYYKATANDIDWVAKVKMQGAVQKWVDHSISVTVNVPNDVTPDLIDKIYRAAWEHGCKGMTVYRDGSRSGVLVSNDKKEDQGNPVFRETNAPPRPLMLDAEIVRFQNDNEKWIAVVGILDGRPYEIFTGKADGLIIPPFVQDGWVKKVRDNNGRSRYDLVFLDKDGYEVIHTGLSRAFDKEFWNYAKLISGILRHGMPLPFVVDIISKLSFESDSINNWKNGVERALKKFIPDGTKAKNNKCPECKDEDGLQYKEGCLTCKNCGYSKCG